MKHVSRLLSAQSTTNRLNRLCPWVSLVSLGIAGMGFLRGVVSTRGWIPHWSQRSRIQAGCPMVCEAKRGVFEAVRVQPRKCRNARNAASGREWRVMFLRVA
jgi:hypothetical protein